MTSRQFYVASPKTPAKVFGEDAAVYVYVHGYEAGNAVVTAFCRVATQQENSNQYGAPMFKGIVTDFQIPTLGKADITLFGELDGIAATLRLHIEGGGVFTFTITIDDDVVAQSTATGKVPDATTRVLGPTTAASPGT